jgi:hypothetical protein
VCLVICDGEVFDAASQRLVASQPARCTT